MKTLAEKYMYATISPENGQYIVGWQKVNFGFSAAILLDLYLTQQITIDEDKEVNFVIDKATTAAHSAVIELIKGDPGRKLSKWFIELGEEHFSNRVAVLSQLVNDRFFRTDDDRVLGFGNLNYTFADKYSVDKLINDNLGNLKELDSVILLDLMKTAGLLQNNKEAFETIDAEREKIDQQGLESAFLAPVSTVLSFFKKKIM